MVLTIPVKENSEFENCNSNDLSKDSIVEGETIASPIFNIGIASFLDSRGLYWGFVECFRTMGCMGSETVPMRVWICLVVSLDTDGFGNSKKTCRELCRSSQV